MKKKKNKLKKKNFHITVHTPSPYQRKHWYCKENFVAFIGTRIYTLAGYLVQSYKCTTLLSVSASLFGGANLPYCADFRADFSTLLYIKCGDLDRL